MPAVAQGQPIGLQTSVYYLPYFPEEMRFHFNAHNLVVYGKEGDNFSVSDPVFEEPVIVASRHLNKARFARGPLAPKGLMYRIESVPERIDYTTVIPAAIKKNCKVMLGAPLPVIGIRGVRYLSRKIAKLRGSEKEKRLFLGHIVRMQEEIGTGGAGFRFLYASFLQEASVLLKDSALATASNKMTDAGDAGDAGDAWRAFVLAAAQECKKSKTIYTEYLAQRMLEYAEKEVAVWRKLSSWCKKYGQNKKIYRDD